MENEKTMQLKRGKILMITNSTGGLGDHGAALERLVDALDAVILHCQQEAAATKIKET